ncbi:MAG: arylsulfatase, partial [Candidatus Aminicenantes bacterium]|nr:arylsulfatase [Candidatus Aminicenantes bacterium]
LLDLAGARPPEGVDGVSLGRHFEGRAGGPSDDRALYMEFPAYGGQQMARLGRWKGVRQGLLKDPDAPVELYDLEADPGETANVAAAHPEVVAELAGVMARERRPSELFPFPALDRGPSGRLP